MPSVGRNKVHSLQPLNQRQVDYFMAEGLKTARDFYTYNRAWWLQYFATPTSKTTSPPVDAWEDPGYDISNKFRYFQFVYALREELTRARTSRQTSQNLLQRGAFPPVPAKGDPYAIPDYFGWWQAENAFRRGYMEAYEDAFVQNFKTDLKNRFRSDGNILTRSTMERFSETYDEDPIISAYFKEMIASLDKGQPWPLNSLKATYNDILQRREKAYQQFSPYFQPLRWLPGAGLVGIEE